MKKIFVLILTNILILLGLFTMLEVAYRIYRDGIPRAFMNIVYSSDIPYSNLGTSDWVIYDNELGYRLNPNREDINSLSVRHEEIVIPKPPGLFRILFLGDSIPWDRPGFVDYIREELMRLGGYEVINASVPGYTSYQEMLFFKRYLSQTDPDLVIWIYCLNDNHKFLHRFDEKARMLWTPQAEESLKINSTWDVIISRSYLLNALRLRIMAWGHQTQKTSSSYVWENTIDFNIAWKDYAWGFYEGHLREMTRLLKRHEAKLAIVAIPYEPQLQYRHDATQYDYVLKPQRLLIGLCAKHGVSCLDMYGEFGESYDRGNELYRDGIHLNNTGHRLTASIIQKFIVSNNLLAPR